MTPVTLSKKHKIKVPKEVWEAMGWKPGDQIALTPSGKGMLLTRVPTSAQRIGIAKETDGSQNKDR